MLSQITGDVIPHSSGLQTQKKNLSVRLRLKVLHRSVSFVNIHSPFHLISFACRRASLTNTSTYSKAPITHTHTHTHTWTLIRHTLLYLLIWRNHTWKNTTICPLFPLSLSLSTRQRKVTFHEHGTCPQQRDTALPCNTRGWTPWTLLIMWSSSSSIVRYWVKIKHFSPAARMDSRRVVVTFILPEREGSLCQPWYHLVHLNNAYHVRIVNGRARLLKERTVPKRARQRCWKYLMG